MRVIVTGSCGLIGSEASAFYASKGNDVLGIDNNMRKYFFGNDGDTSRMKDYLTCSFSSYQHGSWDLRERNSVSACLRDYQPEFIIHTAAQPSHDWAASEPFTDFEVNAVVTLNLLEAVRRFCPNAIFAFLSTNKVYGDWPNHLALEELPTRFEYDHSLRGKGIDETLSIDSCLHSLFGASKTCADIYCQEYGKYFGLKTGVFRGGCLTGQNHFGVKLHGYLSYLINCAVSGEKYVIYGYKGKQVRDQIHSSDVIQALESFRANPRAGEVYNIGGGYENSISILETIAILKEKFGYTVKTDYVDQPRRGDHICYYTNLGKFKKDYPEFSLRMSLDKILEEMVKARDNDLRKAA